MKLQQGDVFYGTVGVLGLCGVIAVVRVLDNLLTPIVGYELALLAGAPVIVWGGLTSFIVTCRAFKGSYGESL